MLPIFGTDLISLSSGARKKFKIKSVLKGSLADSLGFSSEDPLTVYKAELDKNGENAYFELSAKKRKNGYIEMSMGVTASLDSPYYF